VSKKQEEPTPTAVLTEFLRNTKPGQVVSWVDMETEIDKPPKMYWKGARRTLKKDGVCFSIVDGVGLLRTHGRMINRAVRVELDTRTMSKKKLKELYQNAGFQRFVYNWAVTQHKEHGWPIGGKAGAADRKAAIERKKRGEKISLPKKLSVAEVSARWTHYARDNPDLAWTRECIGSVCRFAIAAVDDAYKHALRRSRQGEKAGWPRIHGGGSARQFTLQDQNFRWTRNAIKIGKLGMIPIRQQRVTALSSHPHQLRVLEGARILRLAIEEKAGRWWCSIMYEREDTDPLPKGSGRAAGIDLGYSITVSDGTDSPPVYDAPPWKSVNEMRRNHMWQRQWDKAMSRRYKKKRPFKEQSRRWRKAKRMVQKLHLKVAQIRKDWIEQISDDLTKRYDVIAIEVFDVRQFVSKKVKYRKGRRKILDMGWGMLRAAIKRKAEARGKVCEDRGKLAATDQTCSRCGARNERIDGLFRCPNEACGHMDTRPRNTADLLYRVATGTEPEGFPDESPETPVGETGVNTRGAGQERSSGRQRRSEIRHAQRRKRGRGAKSAPTTSQPEKARDTKSRMSRGNGSAKTAPLDGQEKAGNGQKRRKARKPRDKLPKTPRASARDETATDRDLNAPNRGAVAE
jgi:putative transposase